MPRELSWRVRQEPGDSLPGAPSAPGGVLESAAGARGRPPGCAGCPGRCPGRARREPLPGAPSAPGRYPGRAPELPAPHSFEWKEPVAEPFRRAQLPQVFCLFAGHLPSLLHIGVKREAPYTVSPTVAPGPTFGRGVTTCEGREEAWLGDDKTGDAAFIHS